ncbi:hypothetical protein INR49_025699 [Caranx melampygus]|nr:hypothetical protein INR49_025699 [Caranx melampygus]
MNLVPHLEQIANKGPWRRARRRWIFCVVQLGGVMVAFSAPEGHQEEENFVLPPGVTVTSAEGCARLSREGTWGKLGMLEPER